MGKKDVLAKKYMRNPRKFADFFNGIIYAGEEVIDWQKLEEVDTANFVSIPVNNRTKTATFQKFRDIIKSTVIMRNDKYYFMLLGIENQADVHYAMPVRTMLYNALTYTEQIDTMTKERRVNGDLDSKSFISGFTKEDKLIPVITVTLYWGTDTWNAPTTLKEMLPEMDGATASLVNDFNINLFSIIDKADMPDFKTELKELFAVLNARNNGGKMKDIISTNEIYKHMDHDTAEMMSNFANLKLPRKNKEGEYNMCKAVVEIKAEGIAEGIAEGKKEGEKVGTIKTLTSLVKDGLLNIDEAAKRAGLSVEDFKKILDKA